jgi:hypothetical protein
MEWELDPNDPRMQPLDPNDRLANARRFNWDEPGPMRARPKRRQASDEEVRRQQFETARRIIFGTRIVNTDEPEVMARERHTSAGMVEWDQISFNTPFPLGQVRLMITKGMDDIGESFNEEGIRRSPKVQARRKGEFISVVWMEMAGPLRYWHSRGLNMSPQSVDMKYGLMVAGNWLCIGVLRLDHFIPMMPNLMHTLGVHVIEEESRTDNDYVHAVSIVAEGEGEVLVEVEELVNGFYEAELDEDVVRSRYEWERGDDEGSEEWLERSQQFVDDDKTWILAQSVDVTWEQIVPGVPKPVTIADNILTLDRDDQDDIHYLQENHDLKLDNESPGTWDIRIVQSGDAAQLTYKAPVPFDRTQRFFNESVPPDFMARFAGNLDVADGSQPCTFFFPTHGRDVTIAFSRGMRPVTRIDSTAWRIDDIALICYAQSYLMHVLTGPDRRNFFEDANDKSPMKETQEPRPCFVLRRDADEYSMLELCLARPDPVPFQSFESALYFFTSSLAWRAARVLEFREADRAKAMGRGYGAALAVGFATGVIDPHQFFVMMDMIQKVKDRMQKYEFMGSPMTAAAVTSEPVCMGCDAVTDLTIRCKTCKQKYCGHACFQSNWRKTCGNCIRGK